MPLGGAIRLAMTTVLALAIQAPMAAAAPAPVVFFDIAAPTLPSQAAFYHDIFDWQIKPDGTQMIDRGYFTAVAERSAGRWRFRDAHWSSVSPTNTQ